jgi:aldehyde:ferredoxin oxidoreductase
VIEAVTGIRMTPGVVRRVGERINTNERAYNVREGLRRIDDHLPRRFIEEPLSEGASSGTTYKQEAMLDEYYQERGLDLETGIPTMAVLRKLGLGYIANEFKEKWLTKSSPTAP